MCVIPDEKKKVLSFFYCFLAVFQCVYPTIERKKDMESEGEEERDRNGPPL